MVTAMRDPLILMLKGTAPDVYCFKCLAEAFSDVADLEETVRVLIQQGAPIESGPGQCCICQMASTIVRHQQPPR
jgi:hypothetical protein